MVSRELVSLTKSDRFFKYPVDFAIDRGAVDVSDFVRTVSKLSIIWKQGNKSFS